MEIMERSSLPLFSHYQATNPSHIAGTRARLRALIRKEGIEMSFDRSDFLFHEGAHVEQVFLIDSGIVALTHECNGMHRHIYDFIFKDTVIFPFSRREKPIDYSLECLSDGNMHVISVDGLDRILTAEPELHHAVTEIMNEMLERSRMFLGNVMCRQGVGRVAFALATIYAANNRIALQSGLNGEASSRPDNMIHIKQMDLAAAIGVTPVYINQILRKMKDDGMIDLTQGVISILDINILQSAAQI